MDKELKNALEHFEQLNVLIIDDNTLVHGVLTDALRGLGIREIKCAQNAYYGLRLCEQMHFHIVICSFNVQSDKDGFHLLEELKFRGFVKKSTVLIFLSAETSETLVNSIVELQPDDFWVKPLSPSNVKKRLTYALQIKRKLFSIYQAVDHKNFAKAIYYADRFLLDSSLQKYFPNMLRMKGEAYLSLREFVEAERFFKDLLTQYQYSWVHLGYVQALLKQGRIDEIHTLLAELVDKPDTRFATHDMLAQYYIEQENYAQAYQEIKRARELAPRNIERNKKFWDLARLNHDHLGQYQATKAIATHAKNSVHDSPRLLLNVVRAGIDLANTLADSNGDKVLAEAERYLKALETGGEGESFREEILVAQARICNVRKQVERATRIVETHLSLRTSTDIEDNLDKVKVFHELGMREEALKILQAIGNQIAGESLTSQVVTKYIEQEMDERQAIFFTARQLHEMAVEHFQKKRLEPALASLVQALQLSPKNTKLAMNLIKVLITIKREAHFTSEHETLAEQGFNILNDHHFSGSSLEAVNKLKAQWQASMH
ncbi:response regulator [Thalassotalea euphylliae]|uniref:response regulator n=1 Tax=Thalassotalea euphylliae TaxID=1655234 RepID=UPI0015F26060|nr:response regulator [Thalassotalea euphylliae]